MEQLFGLLEIGDHRVGGLVSLIRLPADTFQPNGLATDRCGRDDVLVVRIANDHDLFRRKGQMVNAQLEDGGIGLADAHDSRLDDVAEQVIEPKVFQDRGNIAVKSLLPATYGDSGRSWMMEGYSAADRPGQNWLKFVAQNTVKTRMIRCVKAPVEYIYE